MQDNIGTNTDLVLIVQCLEMSSMCTEDDPVTEVPMYTLFIKQAAK